MTGSDFRKKPYQNVPWLLGQVKEFYTTKVAPLGGPPVFEKTAEIVVRERQWAPSERMFAAHIASILEELNIVYIPKVLEPGPAILFPQLDVRNRYSLARLRPMYQMSIGDNGPAKYVFLGNRADIIGPNWVGLSYPIIRRIIETRMVVLVEGPFDVLACRLVAPNVPVLSTGTKTWNDMHIAHLRMLGVNTIHVMFDSDEAGEKSASYLSRKWNEKLDGSIVLSSIFCPASDPSDSLKKWMWASKLKQRLEILR